MLADAWRSFSEDWWRTVGVVCGALIALGTVLGWVYRKVIRPMWKRGVRTFRRFDRGIDDLLGKPAEYDDEGILISPEVTSLRSEIKLLQVEVARLRTESTAIRADLETHIQWHPSPGGRPAAGTLPRRKGNGARTRPDIT
jgi:hypothetical protein